MKRILTRPELQHLLDTWLAAQNAGDFPAYEALYSPDMHGVKRVGERETRMDRAQWMADRTRMFRKRMEVEAHSVTFRSSMAKATIELVQVFHSGTFMDSGPKKLVVAMHNGAPRIVSEEMLSSVVLQQSAELAEHVYLTLQIGSTVYVVLNQKADPSWGTGDFGVEASEETVTTYTQAVSTDVVPRSAQWLGMPLLVYDGKSAPCSATVTELKIALIADQYFLNEEDQARVAALQGQPAIDARARAIARHEPAMLVGKLSACNGVIATPATQPAPVFYAPQTEEAAITQAAIAATRALPKYKALQAQWEAIWRRNQSNEPQGEPGPWEHVPTITLFGAPTGPRFVLAALSNGGCESEMSEMLFVLYRIDESGKLTLKRTSSSWTQPSLLLDLNGDEIPEVWNRRELRGFGEYGLFLIQEIPEAYNGCGC